MNCSDGLNRDEHIFSCHTNRANPGFGKKRKVNSCLNLTITGIGVVNMSTDTTSHHFHTSESVSFRDKDSQNLWMIFIPDVDAGARVYRMTWHGKSPSKTLSRI